MPSVATKYRRLKRLKLKQVLQESPHLEPFVRLTTEWPGQVAPRNYRFVLDENPTTAAANSELANRIHEQPQLSLTSATPYAQEHVEREDCGEAPIKPCHLQLQIFPQDEVAGSSSNMVTELQLLEVSENIAFDTDSQTACNLVNGRPVSLLNEATVGKYLMNLDIPKGLDELLSIFRAHQAPNNMLSEVLHWFRAQQVDLASNISRQAIPENLRLPLDYRGAQKELGLNSVFQVYVYCFCMVCRNWKPRSMFESPFKIPCCSKFPNEYDSHFVVYQINEILQLQLPYYKSKVKSAFYKGCVRLEQMRRTVNGTEDDVYLSIGFDGVPFSPSSGISVYPILATIDGLSGQHTKGSTFIIGLWMGSLTDSKPQVRAVFAPIISQFQQLAVTPMTWIDYDGNTRKSRVFLSTVLTDTVARPQVMCLTQFNGHYGCAWCLHKNDKNELWDYKNRRAQSDARTNDRMRLQLDEMFDSQGNVVAPGHGNNEGIQGRTPFSDLSYFDIVKDFPPCTMHANYEGVAKLLVELWTDRKHLTTKDVASIDQFLIACKPPNRITRPPRQLKKLKKAHEYCVWMFYTAPVVLQTHLSQQLYQHFLSLVRGLSLLHKGCPTSADICTADTELRNFLRHYSKYYDKGNRRYNIHILQHLCDFVKDRGPLYLYSLMPMESYNKHIKDLPTGPKYVTLQICTRFLEETVFKARVNAKSQQVPMNFQGIGENAVGSCRVDRIRDYLQTNFPSTLFFFERLRLGKKVFHSLSYSVVTTTNSSCYVLGEDIFFDAHVFIQTPAGFFAIGETLSGVMHEKMWYLFRCTRASMVSSVSVADLGSVAFKMLYDGSVYVAKFINNFESYAE